MREKEMRFLLGLKERLQHLIVQKRAQITQIETEIDQLQSDIDQISTDIAACSFTTADSLLDADQAANQGIIPQTVAFTKKIYSRSKDLLVSMQFDNSTVLISFPTPKLSRITQEKYIDQIVKPALVKLKKTETKLQPSIKKISCEGTEVIDSITLHNIENFESFEFLFDTLQKFFEGQ